MPNLLTILILNIFYHEVISQEHDYLEKIWNIYPLYPEELDSKEKHIILNIDKDIQEKGDSFEIDKTNIDKMDDIVIIAIKEAFDDGGKNFESKRDKIKNIIKAVNSIKAGSKKVKSETNNMKSKVNKVISVPLDYTKSGDNIVKAETGNIKDKLIKIINDALNNIRNGGKKVRTEAGKIKNKVVKTVNQGSDNIKTGGKKLKIETDKMKNKILKVINISLDDTKSNKDKVVRKFKEMYKNLGDSVKRYMPLRKRSIYNNHQKIRKQPLKQKKKTRQILEDGLQVVKKKGAVYGSDGEYETYKIYPEHIEEMRIRIQEFLKTERPYYI